MDTEPLTLAEIDAVIKAAEVWVNPNFGPWRDCDGHL